MVAMDGHASDQQIELFCHTGVTDKLELMLIMLHLSQCDGCLKKVVQFRAAQGAIATDQNAASKAIISEMNSTMVRGSCSTVACFERHEQLLWEYARRVSEFQAMQKAELELLRNGDDFSFDDWIAEAGNRMAQAKMGLRAYRQEYG